MIKYFFILSIFLFISNCHSKTLQTQDKLLMNNKAYVQKLDFSSEVKFNKSYLKIFDELGMKINAETIQNIEYLYDDNLKLQIEDYEKFIEKNPNYILQIIKNIKNKGLNEEEQAELITNSMRAFTRSLLITLR
jgi:hypothetical protein